MNTGRFCPSLQEHERVELTLITYYLTDVSGPWIAGHDYKAVSNYMEPRQLDTPWVPVRVDEDQPRGTDKVQAHTTSLRAQQEEDCRG